MTNPRVLVTGCTGLVGHGICLSLLEQGYEVIGTSRRPVRSTHPRFRIVPLDLENASSIDALDGLLADVGALIHNAAKLPAAKEDPDASWLGYLTVNVAATRQLLVAAARARLRQVVYVSGTGILRPSDGPLTEDTPVLPRSNYHASKIAAEAVCLQFDAQERIPVTVLRFPAPYGFAGNAEGVIPRFIKNARLGQPLTLWGTGAREQTFTFVADVGLACGAVIERQARGLYHVSGPDTVSMTDLAHAVIAAFPGTGAVVEYNGQPDPQEHVRVLISREKARRDFGFEPRYSLARGLAAIAAPGQAATIFEAVA